MVILSNFVDLTSVNSVDYFLVLLSGDPSRNIVGNQLLNITLSTGFGLVGNVC